MDPAHFERLYSYFEHMEEVFSPYRATSETSRINSGLLRVEDSSEEMRTVIRLAEKTRVETKGYFDVNKDGVFNPVGIVKGWAVYQASEMLRQAGLWGFYVEAGGRHPTLRSQCVRRRLGCGHPQSLRPRGDREVPVSERHGHSHLGYLRPGRTPLRSTCRGNGVPTDEIVSVTVVGPNVYEADRFATAAFAMGREGIHFLERERGLKAT